MQQRDMPVLPFYSVRICVNRFCCNENPTPQSSRSTFFWCVSRSSIAECSRKCCSDWLQYHIESLPTEMPNSTGASESAQTFFQSTEVRHRNRWRLYCYQ